MFNVKTTVLLVMMSLASPSVLAEDSVPTPATPVTPPAAANTAPTNAPTPAAPAPTPQVARAAFTTGITSREPDSQLARVSAGQTVYYFTELVGLEGHVITHRWEKDGAFQLGLQFPVGGQRWRVHSSKTISPNLPGTWTVTVQNDDGSVLRQDTLVVDPIIPADTIAPAPTPATAVTPISAPTPTPVVTPATAPAAPAPEKTNQAIWETLPR